MQTFSGRQFWPLDPRPEEIDIADIAHALSQQCRYAGHSRVFYSVAEHSVLLARWFFEEVGWEHPARWALLHDATEAYLVDVPRPVKRHLPGYAEIEANLMAVIATRFGLQGEIPAAVKEADDRILIDERFQLMAHTTHEGGWPDVEPLGLLIEGWSPREAERRFLEMAGALLGVTP